MTRIGFIGLGDMGLPMARRILAAGHQLVVWNRSREKLDLLAGEGAVVAASPADLMDQADLVGLCLTSDQAVETVAFGPQGLFGVGVGAVAGKVVADFSTGAIAAAVSFAERAKAQGAAWVDAPVSGGVPAAEEGRLIVFAGGKGQALEALDPMFSAVAAKVTHLGPAGAGQTAKLCNQAIVACNLLVIAETLALARKAGVDVERLPGALKGGFADSAPLQIFGPRMAAHAFEPRLGAIDLMIKDVRMANDLADVASARMPMLELARVLYEEALASPALDTSSDLSRLIGLFEQS
jgi:3-hydroxyisobutyrate dehydrogenase-like beta-hydroxyacid dehydrogenase